MVERAYRAHMHFGAHTKGTHRKVSIYDKITKLLLKDAQHVPRAKGRCRSFS
jgi:hypothetical protein